MTEDVVREIARAVSAKVLAQGSSPVVQSSRDALLAAHTGADADRLLQLLRVRKESRRPLPEVFVSADYREQTITANLRREFPEVTVSEVVTASGIPEKVRNLSCLYIPGLPWQIAARVVSLAADGGPAELITQALLSGVNVIACKDSLESLAASSPQGASGLRAALKELESKLTGLGVELLSWNDLAARLAGQTRLAPATPSQSRLAENAHPSSQTFNEPEEISEFVEFLEHKPCNLEPGKPCVGSARCRALGF